MLIVCWSPKGGSGVSVVAAAVALAASEALVVDLDGDLDAVLAVEADGPGIAGWLAVADSAPPDALARLEVPVRSGLSLIPAGEQASMPADSDGRLLGDLLRQDGRTVVADVGSASSRAAADVLAAAELRLAVVRPCYLALRRLRTADSRCDGVVLVEEPGRALRAGDVEAAAGVPVVARLPWDPAIARAVDAGVLAARPPRVLRRSLAPVAELVRSR
ncbi:MAG: hypothetical protein AAGD18_08650 [Actinomycetota bacterium]